MAEQNPQKVKGASEAMDNNDDNQDCSVSFQWNKEALARVQRAALIMGVPYEHYVKQVLFRQAVTDINDAAKESLSSEIIKHSGQAKGDFSNHEAAKFFQNLATAPMPDAPPEVQVAAAPAITGSCYSLKGITSTSTISFDEQSPAVPAGAAGLPWDSLVSAIHRASNMFGDNVSNFPQTELDNLEVELLRTAALLRCLKGNAIDDQIFQAPQWPRPKL